MGAISAPGAITGPGEDTQRVLWIRLVRRAGRLFRSEGAVAFYFGLLISLVFNFRIVLNPKSLITGGLGDPLLQAWELAWLHHVVTEGGDLWTANQFYPAVDNFAFTDSLLGYLPLSLFGDGQYAAVFRYNVAFVLAFALAFTGCYLLAKQLGSSWQGAALAGVVFAWAPWRLAHLHHLNVVSTGGIALALWALARGHGYSFRGRTEPRPWWIFAGWLIAAWQVSIGFAIGLPFVHLMGVVGLVIAFTSWRRGSRVVIANTYGAAVFLVVTWFLVVPYMRVLDSYGFKRTWREIEVFSPPVNGLWTTPYETWLWVETIFNDHSAIPEPGIGEKLLFPGLVVVLLAVTGLFVSAWRVRVRVLLASAVVVSVVLALGVNFLDGAVYRFLWDYLPGWNAMRTPGRMMLWAILPLALLAAGAVTEFGRLLVDRTQVALQLIAIYLLVPALAALLEGIPRWPHVENPGIPPDVKRVFTQTREPILMLPIDETSEFTYLLWSTEGFPKLANGNSGNFPPQYQEIAEVTKAFPDQRSVDVLRHFGIRKVVVVKSRPFGVDFAARPVDGLPVDRVESGDIVEFTITG
ncbi:hypothetical protein C8D87_10276 [Lentzea atacamensis]|uniref:Glycosyltransferase RgtA/B/C/D-like domain-containing protein n=1 Tax=Lentzea atacamensis TaxID=531938 RepID=A0ABX9EEE8_9PSEU|nr:hypothetical protein C8D87_10276 [Lentzea atacamensis]